MIKIQICFFRKTYSATKQENHQKKNEPYFLRKRKVVLFSQLMIKLRRLRVTPAVSMEQSVQKTRSRLKGSCRPHQHLPPSQIVENSGDGGGRLQAASHITRSQSFFSFFQTQSSFLFGREVGEGLDLSQPSNYVSSRTLSVFPLLLASFHHPMGIYQIPTQDIKTLFCLSTVFFLTLFR